MKIFIFTENHYKGGLDTFLINLFNNWPEPRDELLLCCNASHPGLETIICKVRRVVRIMTYRRFYTSAFVLGRGGSMFSRLFVTRAVFAVTERILRYPVLFPWYVFTLWLQFRRSEFDRLMVVNGGYPASLLCRAAVVAWGISSKKSKAILNFHSLVGNTPWYFGLPEYLLDLVIVRYCAHIVSVSRNCLYSIHGRSAFVGYKKLRLIYNGISDPLPIFPVEGEPAHFVTENPYCLMLATYEELKGHAFLLEAFKVVVQDFPNVQLRICGYGRPADRNRVARTVSYYGLEDNVSLSDFVLDPTALIANAAMVVVPSQAFESFGLTIVEAMAIGTPVVATDVGGIPEVLENGSAGYICERNDAAAFATAMKRILGDKVLAAELGRNGRVIYKSRFTAERMADQYRTILESS